MTQEEYLAAHIGLDKLFDAAATLYRVGLLPIGTYDAITMDLRAQRERLTRHRVRPDMCAKTDPVSQKRAKQ